MLSRRHIRIKVFQILYAYFNSPEKNVSKSEKELVHSLNKVYDLYLYLLTSFENIRNFAEKKMDAAKLKNRPKEEDLNPNLKFINNKVFHLLSINKQLDKICSEKKINWVQDDQKDVVENIWHNLRKSDMYKDYMADRINHLKEDRDFAVSIFKEYIINNELLQDLFEDKSVYWNDDLDLVAQAVISTIKMFDEDSDEFVEILSLYKDEDDERFARKLLNVTCRHENESVKLIDKYTQNWEVDRIALTDIILMKMALAEVQEFSSIPVKVTLNEYIEISKFYSTPKSNTFINGVLDKSFDDLKTNEKVKKIGRGLIT